MKKSNLMFWLDFILFISVCELIITGIIMVFLTSSGPHFMKISKYFLNLHRHQWAIIHSYFAFLFSLFIVIHLILEWNWIKVKIRKLIKKQWILVLLVSFPLILLFIIWCITPKTGNLYRRYAVGWKDETQLINSKKNIEEDTNYPVKRMDKGFEQKPMRFKNISELHMLKLYIINKDK